MFGIKCRIKLRCLLNRHFMSLLSKVIVLSFPKKIPDKLLARASMGSNGSIV